MGKVVQGTDRPPMSQGQVGGKFIHYDYPEGRLGPLVSTPGSVPTSIWTQVSEPGPTNTHPTTDPQTKSGPVRASGPIHWWLHWTGDPLVLSSVGTRHPRPGGHCGTLSPEDNRGRLSSFD